ncbi:hypothetical protein OIU84_027655 [Salix udensis]|uniref:ZF-HD dimerization-type domain-containing protein n=1 Tax=Salix udensis TaxID=889485 RepID=A0AAD6KHZ7_9ROSI|nr:hypothetical protein OIU84_027655 [Salix udensis]
MADHSDYSRSKPLDEEESTETTTKYGECWRNHAVLIGGYAVDGCGEFTPKGDQATGEGFICEACGCHRNFHRKQLIKNGVVLLDTHHSPPPYKLHGGARPYIPVSDEESLVYTGSNSEKAGKRPKRCDSVHSRN